MQAGHDYTFYFIFLMFSFFSLTLRKVANSAVFEINFRLPPNPLREAGASDIASQLSNYYQSRNHYPRHGHKRGWCNGGSHHVGLDGYFTCVRHPP